MQNKGKLTIMKYFRACVGSFLVIINIRLSSIYHDFRLPNQVDLSAHCSYNLQQNIYFLIESSVIKFQAWSI